MINESKKIEFWNYLTTEKNQPRPKGITVQRLAVIKPAIIGLDELWLDVIERHGAEEREAVEFYRSGDSRAALSRAQFWEAVRNHIRRDEQKPKEKNDPANRNGKSRRARRSRDRY
jgi:hypothetical protein